MNVERPSTRQRLSHAITSISPNKRKIIAIIVGVLVFIVVVGGAVLLYFLLRPKYRDDPVEPPEPSSSALDVFSKAAVVSLGEPCSGIGKSMLEKGGSAADAAIASMLCVGAWVMQSMGLGGSFILTLYDRKSKASHCLVARETAPAAATEDMFSHQSSRQGPQAAGVPGALKGYQELHQKFGKLPWRDLFLPTIELCEKGIIVNKRLAFNFHLTTKEIKNSSTFMGTILKDLGRIPIEGDIVKLPELAKTLRTIANSPNKSDAFYKGELTKSFVKDITEGGGLITEEDLNKYKVTWEKCISVPLSGERTVYTSALPGSGVLLGFLLRIMDGVTQQFSLVEHSQFLVEAFKHAFARRSFLCDPQFVNKSVVDETLRRLSDDEYIREVREKIKPFWTTNNDSYYGDLGPVDVKDGTDSMVIVDAEGSAISVTSSIHSWFGCVFVSKSTGIILNNHMADFSRPSDKTMKLNYIEPGKRPASSMCPSVVVDSQGDVRLVVSGAGDTTIVSSVAQVMESNLFLGKDIKQSIDEPRFYNALGPKNTVVYEYGIIKEVVDSWKKTGYNIARATDYIAVVTGIARRGKELTASCDSRKCGSVDGY